MSLLALWIGALLLSVGLATGQESSPSCPTSLLTVFERAALACDALSETGACHGGGVWEAQSFTEGALAFDQAGDLIGLDDLSRLTGQAMNSLSEWSVALLRAQLLDSGEAAAAALLLALGEVSLDDLRDAPQPSISIRSEYDVIMRARPSAESAQVGGIWLRDDPEVSAIGRSANGLWLWVVVTNAASDERLIGWVYAPLFEIDSNLERLPIISTSGEQGASLSPLQAFNFSSAFNDAPCVELPNSGLLIQRTAGEGVSFRVNGVSLDISGTVYLQAAPNSDFIISVLEGELNISYGGQIGFAVAGTRLRVALDEQNEPTGAAIGPEPYAYPELQNLPTDLLDRPLEIIPALSTEAIQALAIPLQSGVYRVVNINTNCGNAYSGAQPNANVSYNGQTVSLSISGGFGQGGGTTLFQQVAPGLYQQSGATLTVITETRFSVRSLVPTENCTITLIRELNE